MPLDLLVKIKRLAVVSIVVVAACQGLIDYPAVVPISLEDLQQHRWVIDSINDVVLPEYARAQGFDGVLPIRKIPELDFGEQGHVSGNTGCNLIQGKASVENNTLHLSSLASTRMACSGFAGELELRLLMLYARPLVIIREGKTLILKNGNTKLQYQQKDTNQ